MKDIIIKRNALGIGWIDGIKFYDIKNEKEVKLKSYNGCLCFIIDGKRIGYKTWKEKSIESKIIIKQYCPF